MSTVAVGKKYGISSTGVSKILKRNGIETRGISEAKKGVKRGTKLPIDKILSLYLDDLKSSDKIAEEIGCSKRSVLNILNNHGVDMRSPGWSKDYINPLWEEIRDLYVSGKSILDISETLDLSYGGIRKILDKMEIIKTEEKHKGMVGVTHTDESKKKTRSTWNKRKENGDYDHIYLSRTGYIYKDFIKIQPLFAQYRQKVRSVTNQQEIEKLDNYDKRGVAGVQGAYHLDHKYSVKDGFINDVDPEVLGDIANLEFIPWEDNLKKNQCSSITLDELNKLIK